MQAYVALIAGIILTGLGANWLWHFFVPTPEDTDPFFLIASGLLAFLTGLSLLQWGYYAWDEPRRN